MASSATHTDIEDEIVTLETAYWDAVQANDIASALGMTHDPCIVTGARGAATFDHEAMATMSKQRPSTLTDYSIDNMHVQALGDGVAVLGYNIELIMDVDGKSVAVQCAESSTWVKQNGTWLCALHSESPLGDEFGNSREAKQQ